MALRRQHNFLINSKYLTTSAGSTCAHCTYFCKLFFSQSVLVSVYCYNSTSWSAASFFPIYGGHSPRLSVHFRQELSLFVSGRGAMVSILVKQVFVFSVFGYIRILYKIKFIIIAFKSNITFFLNMFPFQGMVVQSFMSQYSETWCSNSVLNPNLSLSIRGYHALCNSIQHLSLCVACQKQQDPHMDLVVLELNVKVNFTNQ